MFLPFTDEESDNNDKQTELNDTLREGVNLNEVNKSNCSVDIADLLKRLRKTVNPNLPASSGTLLKTPWNIDLLRVWNLDYFHFGLELMIKEVQSKGHWCCNQWINLNGLYLKAAKQKFGQCYDSYAIENLQNGVL